MLSKGVLIQRKYNKNIEIRLRKAFVGDAAFIRTSDALKVGVQARDLASFVSKGILEKVSRGLYKLADSPAVSDIDLATVAARIPNGIISLVSALVFHELSTQIPRQVHVALKAGSEKPRLAYPPTKFFWFSGKAYSDGIETHTVDGIPINVYSIEKSLADCFKFRNKIGIDVAVEALRAWAPKNRKKWDKLLHFAKICRVEKIVRQYLEAMA